jgi:hypothetical protein
MPDRFSLWGSTDAAQTRVSDKREAGPFRAKPRTDTGRDSRQPEAFEAGFSISLAGKDRSDCEDL